MNEHHNPRARKHVLFALKLAAVMVGGALLLTLARKLGWIEAELVTRAYNVIMGLALAAYGNAMPKFMHEMPPRSIHEATLAQAVARVTSWAMTLAFLAWAALWAFAPLDVARIGGIAVVGTSAVVMIGFIAWKCASTRALRHD
jgi:hypothetical protein